MKSLVILSCLLLLGAFLGGCELFESPSDPNVIAAFTPLHDGTNSIRIRNESVGASQYWWDSGDGQTSRLFEPHFFYPLDGTYLISLRACPGDKIDASKCDVAEQWVEVPQ